MNVLLSNIKSAVLANATLSKCLEVGGDTHNPRWSVSVNKELLHDERTYILELGNLWLQVLRSKYDHKLAGYLGESKTYQLICRDYSWPNMKKFVKDYVKFLQYLHAQQGEVPQTLWTTQTVTDSSSILEVHIYGLHWAAPGIPGLHRDIGSSGPTYQVSCFHTNSKINRHQWSCRNFCEGGLLQTWGP